MYEYGWMDLEPTHSPSPMTCGTLRMYSPSEEQHRMVGGPQEGFLDILSDGEGGSNPDPTSVLEIPPTAPILPVVILDAHGMHWAGRHAKPATNGNAVAAGQDVQERRRERRRTVGTAIQGLGLPSLDIECAQNVSCGRIVDSPPPGVWTRGLDQGR